MPERRSLRAAPAGRWTMRLALAGTLVLPTSLGAQGDVEHLGRIFGTTPPPGYYEMLRRVPNAFEFSPDNGWIRRARAVREARAQARARLMLDAVQPGGGAARVHRDTATGAFTGTLHMPVFLAMYANTDAVQLQQTWRITKDTLQFRLFGTHAPTAGGYSVTNYYREISDNRVDVLGTVLDWFRVARDDAFYEGGCNGLCFTSEVDELIRELVLGQDNSVDFSLFDNNGPDGIPNSADDDGFVDGIVVLHPEVDGACGNQNVWAHRFTYRGWTGSDLQTNDAAFGGGKIKIRDYIIQGGQGGVTGCAAQEPQAMGLVAHETGHLFGLPDLYNTDGSRPSEGVGHWGLMGSGNWRFPTRPVYMESWSRAELGWVTEVLLAADSTGLAISPVESADTAYIVPITGSREFFLLENRQRIGADVSVHQPGLLIWHIDSLLVAQRRFTNRVNASSPEAVRLIQADTLGHLQRGTNRGDQGDPYPGSTNNQSFGVGSKPASSRNNGAPSCVLIDNITQVVPDGPVRVDVQFVPTVLIAASDTLAAVLVNSVSTRRFEACVPQDSVLSLSIDSAQVASDNRTRFIWQSWSNGQPRTHSFTVSAGGDTVTANVTTQYLVKVTVSGPGGSVSASPAADVASGAFLDKGSGVTLTANVTLSGHVFEGWSGDTTSTASDLPLTANRPYDLTATFAAPLAAGAAAPPQAIVGTNYSFAFDANGGTGAFVWRLVSGALPKGLLLGSDGRLVGRPEEAGTFNFDVRVTSGIQSSTRSIALVVVTPALSVADVVAHLVGTGQPLSADDRSFLDIVGNRNNRFDLGDVLGWLRVGGASITAEQMQQILAAASREAPLAAPRQEQRP